MRSPTIRPIICGIRLKGVTYVFSLAKGTREARALVASCNHRGAYRSSYCIYLDLGGIAPARTGYANLSCCICFVLADVGMATVFLADAVEDSAIDVWGDYLDAARLLKVIPI